MTPTRIPNARSDRKGRTRIAPVWIAVFLSLGLLGVLGIRGLQRSREAVLETARKTSAAAVEQVGRFMIGAMEKAPKARRLDVFPEVPRPAGPSSMASAFEEALKLPAEQAEEIFASIERDHPDTVTAAGLPILPLIAWARLERAETHLADAAATMARRVVYERPSILSEKLLEEASAFLISRGVSSDVFDAWKHDWARDEQIRESLRAMKSNAMRPQWIHGQWWVYPAEPGTWRVIPLSDVRHFASDSVAAVLLPAAVTVSVRWAGHELTSPIAGETLASRDISKVSVSAILTNPEDLFRDQRRQTLWLSGLLAIAILAVVSAFFAMQRSLVSERQLSQQKSDFVSSVSHELRAPVSSLRLMLENLQNGSIISESSRGEYLRLMEGECRRLSSLIENVLDFARIEHNRKSYEMAEADVKTMIEDVARLFEPRAAQRRQRLISELETIEPEVDALALQQAVINLVDNALKFSPEKTAITIRTKKRDAAHWELSVSDEGPGIPVHERERIFERFYRIGNELRRETPGAGIGLAIVKHTVEAHGGRIEVECASGTTFRLILPFHPGRAQS